MTTRILQAGFITLACIGTGCLAKAQQSKKPNILFIFPDQYRVQSLGFLNEDPVKTPNLDRLASEGMYCENAVSCMPLSSPYRGILITITSAQTATPMPINSALIFVKMKLAYPTY